MANEKICSQKGMWITNEPGELFTWNWWSSEFEDDVVITEFENESLLCSILLTSAN